jgi:hypothetical protein
MNVFYHCLFLPLPLVDVGRIRTFHILCPATFHHHLPGVIAPYTQCALSGKLDRLFEDVLETER